MQSVGSEGFTPQEELEAELRRSIDSLDVSNSEGLEKITSLVMDRIGTI
jgi:hypothetical protein